MKLMSDAHITTLLRSDPWRMCVLARAEKLDLPNWWIGAGFLRNLIWDVLEGNEPRQERDVDLVYFDGSHIEPEYDWSIDEILKKDAPYAEWEVRNQARMHYVNGFEPYSSTEEGIANWVETATCVAVRLKNDQLEYLFCHGTDDLFSLTARPIGQFKSPELLPIFYARIERKKWRERWPSLTISLE